MIKFNLLKGRCGMSLKNMTVAGLLIIFITFAFSACMMNPITITNAKIASGVDEKLMPVGVMDVFPAGTSQAFCWFEWKNAKAGTKIIARWHFVTDNVHILNYKFTIPKKEGFGSVSLAMPESKKLPEGLYKIELCLGETVLKSLTFKVQ
jgi:hypothetical protein